MSDELFDRLKIVGLIIISGFSVLLVTISLEAVGLYSPLALIIGIMAGGVGWVFLVREVRRQAEKHQWFMNLPWACSLLGHVPGAPYIKTNDWSDARICLRCGREETMRFLRADKTLRWLEGNNDWHKLPKPKDTTFSWEDQ